MMADKQQIRIWDIWIRLFHWILAFSIIFQLINAETGWQFFDWHRHVGEFVLALVVFRILWGVLGSSNARLGSLVTSPKAVVGHLRDLLRRSSHEERGHNAAGGWAVLLMLLIVAVQAVTGFFIADEDEYIEGALYGSISGSSSDLMYQIHEFNAGLIQAVVALHVLMVLVYLVYAKQNLITPMISGSMKWLGSAVPPQVNFQKIWVGAILLAVSLTLVGFVAGWY